MSDQQQPQEEPNKNSTTTKKRRRRDMDPEVKTSKALSWILRHGAPSLKLDMGPDGYVPLAQLLSSTHPKVRGMTFEVVQTAVTSNAKQRFSMIQRDGDEWFIRANQGHSIKRIIDPYQLLTPIPNLSTIPTIVHGTYLDAWTNHIQTQGLSKMNRTHIHFAKGMPTEDGVISGMRNSCTVFIYIDTGKCCADSDSIDFFESSNGVVLTAGVNGILEPKYFSHVLSKSGEVLFDHRTS
jgi:2'-phosphotransferase